MTRTLDGLTDLALVLQGSTGEATGQQFALLVHELHQEIRVLVVDVFDAVLLEAAVFFPGCIHRRRIEVPDLLVDCSTHGCSGLGDCFFLLFQSGILPLLFIVSNGMLVESHGEETHDAFIALVLGLKSGNQFAGRLEFE